MEAKKFKQKAKYFIKNYEWKIPTKIIILLIMVLLVAADQIIKFTVIKHLKMNVEYNFLPGFINLKYVINHGSAFGLNQNKTGMLITIAFLIIFALMLWLIFSKSTANLLGISFIMAGTIGNLLDRFLHNGGVIDFLAWELFNPKTVFNSADLMISIGIAIIIIYIIFSFISDTFFNREKETKEKNNCE